MVKKNILFVFFGIFITLQSFAFDPSKAMPDTIRKAKTGSGKKYILHKVEAGQTLYAVMRLYKISIKELKEANPGMNEQLSTGQMVRVPVGNETKPVKEQPKIIPEPVKIAETKKETPAIDPVQRKIEEKAAAENKPEEKKPEITKSTEVNISTKAGYHKVDSKQSLYSIAVKYGVLMADIRRWNNLASDQLRAGQEIIVSEHTYQDYLRRTKLDSSKLAENKKNNPEKPNLPPPIESNTNGNLPEPKVTNLGKRTIETGIAEVIDVGDNGNKYLALHRTAAVGSLVQVKNINNNQSIWVKVVGKLPDIDANRRIIIKLSAKAYTKLSPGNPQFRAEISYLSE